MNITKRKILMNAFFNSRFSYCPLTWMFHSRKLNNKINKLHGRCLRIVHNNNTSTYEELLETDNSASVHFRNVQALAISYIRPQFVNTLFIVRLRPNISMHRAVIINYYFSVHKMEVENLILLSTQVLLRSNQGR